jgi:poly-gamma-glutamate capsule biosynthesis protein CapA/YwtB (metallophosphatase superfamily)
MMAYESESGRVQIAVTGDSMITRKMSVFREPEFLDLVELLRAADVSITNAEMLFHNFESAAALIPGGSYMRAAPAIIDELRWLGIDMFGCANNHSYDFGENGLVRHVENLESSGVPFAGIGRSMGDARAPAYVDTRGGRVALISVTSSGPQAMYAQYESRDGRGRPGANMLRYTSEYTVDAELFAGLKRLRSDLRLVGGVRDGGRASGYRDHSLGLSQIPETEDSFYLGDLHDHFQYPMPSGYRIVRGDRNGLRLIPNGFDIDENMSRIRNAKAMADWVVVSFHNHESGASSDLPSNAATVFAQAAIDNGADVVMGHGPHRDRGIELYRGRPIFYSIGHFIAQSDTIDRIPADNVVRMGLNPSTYMPADFFDMRSGKERADEWIGRSSSAAAWSDVVGVVEFDAGRLTDIALHPIDLGFKLPRSQRGRPVLARGERAREVLELFRRLSAPYGTEIAIDEGGVGHVVAGAQ